MSRGTWRWLGLVVVFGGACQPTLDGPSDYRILSGVTVLMLPSAVMHSLKEPMSLSLPELAIYTPI
jgi:hypothetical protein